MNVHPMFSRNYEKAIKKTSKMNQGARHTVGDKRLSIKQIADTIGMSVSRTTTLLKMESAEHLINRKS